MTSVALVSLDTVTGKLNRYLGLADEDCRRTKPEWTASASFNNWPAQRYDEPVCVAAIQDFRRGVMPPPPDNDPAPPGCVGFASA